MIDGRRHTAPRAPSMVYRQELSPHGPYAIYHLPTAPLQERFFVHHVRHIGGIAAVVALQHIDQPLNASARHAFVRICGKACDASGTGEMREEANAVLDRGIA